MQRSEAWYREQAEKGRRELDKLFADARARHSAAAALYPRHRRSSEIARRPTQTPAKPSAASVIWPSLSRTGSE